MPTNIQYKDNILTTISGNQSKTLKTAGKYMEADVIVANVLNTQNKTATITPTGSTQTQTITADSNYEGLFSVTVTVNPIPSSYTIPAGTVNITSNGVTSVSGYASANVSVSPNLQTKATTVIPSETAQTVTLTPDSGKDGLSSASVTVNGITSTYVGSGITTNPTITVSGPTVTVPSGYYDSQQTKTITLGVMADTITIPFTAVNNFSIDENGLITATRNYMAQTNAAVKSAGYITTNDKIRIELPKSTSTYQLPTLPAQSFTPSSTTQTVASTGKYMLGNITVQPIPSEYVIPTGTLTITASGTTDVTNYAAVTVPEGEFYGQVVIPADLTGGTSTVQWAVDSTTGLVEVSQTGDGMLAPIYGSGYFSTSDSIYVYHGFSDDYQLPTLPAQTITPTESTQTISSTGKYMTGDVTVNPITPTYVGSGVTTNPSVTVSGRTVTIPAGYYNNQQTKEVAQGYLRGFTYLPVDLDITGNPGPTSSFTISSSGVIHYGYYNTGYLANIVDTPGYIAAGTSTDVAISIQDEYQLPVKTASDAIYTEVSEGVNITLPIGYYATTITTGMSWADTKSSNPITINPSITVNNSGLVTVSGTVTTSITPISSNGAIKTTTTVPVNITSSTTYQLSTMTAQTVTPSTATQTVSTSGKYMTGNVTVNPIPSNYIIPSGSISITNNATNIDVSQYATANVNVQPNLTTTVVTATSTIQTITPPSGYVGFSTVTVNAITLVTYYTGITTPASNFGNNGDIYLVTD